ncbi:hypothetical protein BY996DRAFT_4577339 [Phakopsora pachyrhizi]|nr:hypothetical protein BY996DRAFT_4577339 [Phakopsora pachyrhizi]
MEIDMDPIGFLNRLIDEVPGELRISSEKFLDLYQRKLWYQLTIELRDFLSHPYSYQYQIPIYNNFIKDFENKINPLKLVEISVTVSQRFTDPEAALEFLTKLADRLKPLEKSDEDPNSSRTNLSKKFNSDLQSSNNARSKSSSLVRDPEAYVLARMSAAHFCLILGQTKQTEQAMNECRKILDSLDSVDVSVRAGFYRVSGDYYKWEAAYASYYKTSLLYLACLPNLEADLSLESRIQRAHDLSLAALLGDTIYNFGELLQHPILESLSSSNQYQWIRTLLFGFNEGNLGLFDSLVPKLPEEPILQNSCPFLRQKICLMALIDAVFRRSVTDRIMTFETIATETKLPVNEVEHLVMKALSLGLIKGSLDQVSRTVNITWVQPRVLSKEQIQGLKNKLDQWSQRVLRIGQFASNHGGNEILVQ